MNNYRVRLFAVLAVFIILVFSVLGLFYNSFSNRLMKKKQLTKWKRKPNTWLLSLMPEI